MTLGVKEASREHIPLQQLGEDMHLAAISPDRAQTGHGNGVALCIGEEYGEQDAFITGEVVWLVAPFQEIVRFWFVTEPFARFIIGGDDEAYDAPVCQVKKCCQCHVP